LVAAPLLGADTNVYRLDAQCLVRPDNGRPLAPGYPAPSTRRMAAELARINATADPATMAFLNTRIADEYARVFDASPDVRRKLRVGLMLGVQQMQSGRPDAALNTLNTLDSLVADAGGRLGERTESELRRIRAVAFLRLGEQENCIGNHGPDSCLFPIRPAAFHTVTRGSRNAAGLLGEVLRANPADLGARWLLNIAHMTLGEYPGKVAPEWLIPPSAFESEYEMPRFPDVAAKAGLDNSGLAGGTVVDDFDNDGLLDVFVSDWSLTGQLRFYRNTGDGHFVERTSEAGLVGLASGLQILQTDYNNDGFLDLWVPRGAWLGKAGRFPQSLLRNNGDGTFTDVTEEAGLLTRHPSQTGCWFDYDGDGWLDLFKGNESTDPQDPDWCELFHNNHDGTFTECARQSGIAVAAFIKGSTWADYDHDGRPDLYLSCRNGPNYLFHNDGPVSGEKGLAWRFSDTTAKAGVAEPIYSFPTWFFDYDNDGWEDLFVSGYNISGVGDVATEYVGAPATRSIPRLYRNLGNGTFADVTGATHLNHVCHTMGCNYGDLDNDGWLDFYLATGDPEFTTLIPNRMFRNDGGNRFLDVTTTSGTGHLQKGHGVVFADIDNDGDQDVYTVMGGAYTGDIAHNVLFQNPGNTNRWVQLRLVGTKANRPGIGARIKITAQTAKGSREIHRRVSSGASFGGNTLRQEIGLGQATAITGVEIRWPGSDTLQTIRGLEMNRSYQIREGNDTPVLQPSKAFILGGSPSARQPQATALRH